MLQGAIIGAIVGLAFFVFTKVRQNSGGRKVMAALAMGGSEARQSLDAYVAPRQKVPNGKLLMHLERFSWLAIIDDLDTLEHEANQLTGSIGVETQLRYVALAGLLAHRSEQRDVDAMQQVADRIHREGGALMGLVKKHATNFNTVAQAVAGQGPLDTAAEAAVFKLAKGSGIAMKVVLLRFLSRAATASGQDGSKYRNLADAALGDLR